MNTTTHHHPGARATRSTSSSVIPAPACPTCLDQAYLHPSRPQHERELEWHEPNQQREPCPTCYPHPHPQESSMTSHQRRTSTPELEHHGMPDWPAMRASDPEATMTTTHPHNRQRVDWSELYAQLSQPFDERELRYRAGAISKDKTTAQALPYAEPRAYEDRLNHLLPGDWSVTFEPWGDHRIICRLTIHGVTRSSTGEATNSPDTIAGTSAEAQAFKRACAKFGLGRYLYAIPPTWTTYDPASRTITPPAIHRSGPTRGKAADQQEQRLGQQRARAMHHELQRLGLSPDTHTTYASQVLHRRVTDLARITAADAATIWRAAQAADARDRRS